MVLLSAARRAQYEQSLKAAYHGDGNAQKLQGGFSLGATKVSSAAYDAVVRPWEERYPDEDFRHGRAVRRMHEKVRLRPRSLAPVDSRSGACQGFVSLNKPETETGVPRKHACSIKTIVKNVLNEMQTGQAPVERNTDLALAAFGPILLAAAALGYHESYMDGALKTVVETVCAEEKEYREKKVAGRLASFRPTLIASAEVSDEVKRAAELGLARIPLRSPELPCDVRGNVVCARRSRAKCRFGRGSGDRSDQRVSLETSGCSDFAARSPLQLPFAAPLCISPSHLPFAPPYVSPCSSPRPS
jgi:hypothetical protein